MSKEGRFTISQTTGAKLESAVGRNLGDAGGVTVEWMSTGSNIQDVAKLASGKWKLAPVVAAILSAVLGTVSVAATTENFVAKDKFIATHSLCDEDRKKVDIWLTLGANFSDFFHDKVELPFLGSSLKYQGVKNLRDSFIVTELGGDGKAETTLTEIFSLLKKQGHGEKGALLTNGWANVFYIRNVFGKLCTVRLSFSHEWMLFPFPFCDKGRGDYYRVFSRNSVTV